MKKLILVVLIIITTLTVVSCKKAVKTPEHYDATIEAPAIEDKPDLPVVSEALIFITPKDNETKNITMEQVQDIYLNYGIKDWSKLGGPNKEIVPICRNSDSGSQSQLDIMQ